MARELDITINVVDGGAKQALGEVDQATERFASTATTAAERVAELEARLARAAAQERLAANEMRRFASETANSARVFDKLELESLAQKYVTARDAAGKMRTEVKAATGTVDEFAKSSRAGTDALGGLDRMATRIVTRMAILFALRGTFQFVEGLVVAAHQTTQLAENLDLSTTRVQEFQYAAKQTGVPLNAMATALDTMQKKLGEGGPGVLKDLTDLGLTLDEMRAKRPEQAYDAVAGALQTVGDRFRRAGDEAEIFGNDKLDPVIRKFGELKQEARDTGAVLDDEHLKALSDVADGWNKATAAAKAYFAEVLADIALAGQGKGQSGSSSPTAAPLAGAGLLAGGVGGLFLATALGLGGPVGLGVGALLGAAGGIGGGLGLERLRENALPTGEEANFGPGLQTLLGGLKGPGLFGPQAAGRSFLGQNPLNPGDALQNAALDAAATSLTHTAQASLEAARQLEEFQKAIGALTARALKATDDLNAKAAAQLAFRTNQIGQEILNQAAIGQGLTGETLDPFQAATRAKDQAMEALRKKQGAMPGVDFSNEFLKIQQDFLTATEAAAAAAANLGSASASAGVALSQMPSVVDATTAAFASFRGEVRGGYGSGGPAPQTIEQFQRANFTPGIIRSNLSNVGLATLASGYPYVGAFASGGPTSEGLGYLHDDEYVVPRGGALVMRQGGGGLTIGAIHIYGDVDSDRRTQQIADRFGEQIDRRVRQRGRRTLSGPR